LAAAAAAKVAGRRRERTQRTALRESVKRRIEFAPRGSDLTATTAVRESPKAVRATAPRSVLSGPDTTRGEFAPQP
jgi:hypothetical protein